MSPERQDVIPTNVTVWWEKNSTYLIRGARQLITLRGPHGVRRGADQQELTVIHDGALLVRDGIIQEVGPTRRLENLASARDAIEINAAGRVVMPGFVDCHTHLAFPQNGTTPDNGDSAARLRAGTAARLAIRAKAHLEAMARHGTTTVEVKTGCGPDESAETKLLRVLHGLKQDPIDVFATFFFRLPGDDVGGAHDAATDWVIDELLPKIKRRKLARFADMAWNPNPTWHNRFSRYLQAARHLGFGCRIHADQICAGPAIRMAMEHLAVSIDHLEHASASEAAMLAGGSTIATLLPNASFWGADPAPARALIDAGVPVALATDFNPRDMPAMSLQAVVSLACRHLKMTAEEAISAATINAAHVLGRAERTGSLEPGKFADLLILSVPDYRELANNLGNNLVRMTMKRGEVIYQEGGVAGLTERTPLPRAW